MAGSKSNNLENLYLLWALSANAVTRPGTWHVGLFTDAAGMSSDQPATEATSANCPGYARQPVTSWAITNNAAQNGTAVSFTATGAWATVNYFGIYDALTGGNLLYWGSIPAKTLANTDKLDFAVNALTVNED